MVSLSTLHALIEAQARRTPEAAAAAFEGEKLSYAELERRASRLAAELVRQGAGPDVPVGLLIPRSLELVVCLLAILKAGSAYVPLDLAYPPERVRFILSDSGAKLVVTEDTLKAFDWHGPAEATKAEAGPENLAYVIYTSGSTGRPKGVAIEHRNIVNYVLGVAERLRLEPGMSYATVSTIAADLGNTVIFPALATGGCLHVISQARAESGRLLGEYFAREGIDVLKIVPSHLAALQSGKDPQAVMPARRLILGGEASRLDWVDGLRRLAPQCEIFNHYGPTETTVGVLTYHASGALPATQSRTLPLGKPLPGSEVHLLDAQGRRVGSGEKGELCIGGRGVARGYLNRPELTAEKFVADPFGAGPLARLYRTGDLARALPDGALEFCGRIDHQVKIHGYRVELGEIEATLRAQDGVKDAAVIAREDASGDRQLVAYLVADAEVQVIRSDLKERLPQYMVPSAFVLMEKLPLNGNGKVDRQGLAARPLETAQAARGCVAARSDTEKTLVAIWSELLGIEAMGVDDDVFDLGAHSLMAMRALAEIRSRFDVNLALRNLFEHPSVAALAGVIDGLSLAAPRTPVHGGGDREELVL